MVSELVADDPRVCSGEFNAGANQWPEHAPGHLPGNGTTPAAPGEATLTGYVAYVVQEIESTDRKAIIIAHSGGGVAATQVGETIPERTQGIVNITGMMLPSGKGFSQVCSEALFQGH